MADGALDYDDGQTHPVRMIGKIAIMATAILAASPASAQGRLQWSSLGGLTPEEIGSAVLAGHEHAPIVEVWLDNGGLRPPGVNYLILSEMPERSGDGCVRGIWRARIVTEAPARPDMIGLQDEIRRSDAVALHEGGPCLFASFTDVAPNLSVDDALDGLRRLTLFIDGSRQLVCEDETTSDLCRSDQWARHGLRLIQAWHMHRTENATVFWMGVRGQVVTGVTIPDSDAEPVRIRRRIPPPA